MKRSEMLDLMLKAWYKAIENQRPCEDGVRAGMDGVLKAMEESGISPPWREYPCMCSSHGFCPTCAPSLFTSKWETEDGQ